MSPWFGSCKESLAADGGDADVAVEVIVLLHGTCHLGPCDPDFDVHHFSTLRVDLFASPDEFRAVGGDLMLSS